VHKKAIVAKRIAEQANSFKNIALEWYENKTGQFTAKHRSHALARLNTYLFPALRNIAINKLEPQDLLDVARSVEQKGFLALPHRLVQQVGQILRYAIATGRAKHNIAADLRGALKPWRGQNRATITNPEKIGPLLKAIDGYSEYFPLCCALRFAPLVFMRPTEFMRRRMERNRSGSKGVAYSGLSDENAATAHSPPLGSGRADTGRAETLYRGWQILVSFHQNQRQAHHQGRLVRSLSPYGLRETRNMHSRL